MNAAANISRTLGGKRNGKGWLCRCPAHDDHSPSLSIADGESGALLVKCFAGCAAVDVLAALRRRGLLAGKSTAYTYHRQAHTGTDAKDDATRMETALRLWRASRPAADTPVATYLRGRGITLSPPPTLRHYPALKHPGGAYWPGMVALVQRGTDGQPIGIHRTFLDHDGSGKAPVTPDKMMLGLCSGGAVRLALAGNVLMIGEGIETCLAAMQAANLPAWAALSTSGLRVIDLPADVREVIILADGDTPGERAAEAAALRWTHEGRTVRIARPPRGLDFNDMLLGRMPADGTA